ncbi:MAG: hypothetical protein JOZ38_06720 [Candidatus Eremiobacteraeota bacterium]|nr:hypothetical protein [Candidatus Eremiobacteraeota bacterium]
MIAVAGMFVSALLAATAFIRSKRATANSYAAEVYGMTSASHRRFAVFSLVFLLLFAAAWLKPGLPATPLLAVYAVAAILYGSSFLRGATEEDV